jgi:hypothetical protein
MQRPLSYLVIAGVTIIGIVASAVAAGAASGSVSITKSRGKICMASNGLPDHATGRFPNPGNPHRMRAQFIEVCVPENPVRTARATELRGATGFALNGVLIRPGTADYYDPSSPRGFSRDPASGWKLDGKGAGSLLGLDQNNAHVDHRGLYHYHAKPTGLLKGRTSTLVGFAADGFEIHYVGSRARSGYTLKPGDRKAAPEAVTTAPTCRTGSSPAEPGRSISATAESSTDGLSTSSPTATHTFPIAPGARSVATSPGPEPDRGCRAICALSEAVPATRVSGQHLPAIDRHQGSGLSN